MDELIPGLIDLLQAHPSYVDKIERYIAAARDLEGAGPGQYEILGLEVGPALMGRASLVMWLLELPPSRAGSGARSGFALGACQSVCIKFTLFGMWPCGV